MNIYDWIRKNYPNGGESNGGRNHYTHKPDDDRGILRTYYENGRRVRVEKVGELPEHRVRLRLVPVMVGEVLYEESEDYDLVVTPDQAKDLCDLHASLVCAAKAFEQAVESS